jgi:aryl-alcohol dehydrogenase-like predicted oxidoreductase
MSEDASDRTFRLGPDGPEIEPPGVGIWAWGSRAVWGYGRGYTDSDLRTAFEISVNRGVRFFDTAEIYGGGRSEKLLGEFTRAARARDDVLIATKFFPYPWRLRREAVVRALRKSLKRLGVEQVDLYQIHWPSPLMPVETMADGLADAVEAGLTRAVGVSNFNLKQMQRAADVLAKRNVALASNQVEYSLIHRRPEGEGLLAFCREVDALLIAYSPLGMGTLTGKYTPDNPPPGTRGRQYSPAFLRQIQPLIAAMRAIGERHGGRSPAQVALNWVIAKGAFPIPGAKNARQADDNAAAAGWALTEDEVAALDAASDLLNVDDQG